MIVSEWLGSIGQNDKMLKPYQKCKIFRYVNITLPIMIQISKYF